MSCQARQAEFSTRNSQISPFLAIILENIPLVNVTNWILVDISWDIENHKRSKKGPVSILAFTHVPLKAGGCEIFNALISHKNN